MLPPALFVKTQGLALLLPSKARKEDKATDVGQGELQWPLHVIKTHRKCASSKRSLAGNGNGWDFRLCPGMVVTSVSAK